MVEFVKVNTTLPAARGVTTPVLLTVATLVLLLAQVPPEEGLKARGLPIHSFVLDALTVGCA